LVVVVTEDRDKVIASLKANGIAPGVHYLPNYLFPVFGTFDHSLCENVEKVYGKIMSLPNHLVLSRKDVDEICRMLKNV